MPPEREAAIPINRTRARHPRAKAAEIAAATCKATAEAQAAELGAAQEPAAGARVFALYGDAPSAAPSTPTANAESLPVALEFYRRKRG